MQTPIWIQNIKILISEPTHTQKSNSFATAVSELTRGSSTGASGKGHVKSASVSSPGPSVAESNNSAQQSDSLGPRYIQQPHSQENLALFSLPPSFSLSLPLFLFRFSRFSYLMSIEKKRMF